MTKETLKRAAEILRNHDTDNTSETSTLSLADKLEDIADDEESGISEVDLRDMNKYFARILWQRKDLICALQGARIDTLTYNIDELREELLHDQELESCEHGWEVINCTIDNLRTEGRFKKRDLKLLDAKEFLEKFKEKLEWILEYDDDDDILGYHDAVERFDKLIDSSVDFREFCERIDELKGNYTTSNNEAAAFMFALDDMGDIERF